jgi:glycosyltransferase involved in cell wall biosynthesis
MRIALVIAGPYPAFRGSQVLVSHLALGLRRRAHEVHVVSYGAGRGERPGPRPARLALDALLVARLFRVVRRARIALLHAHNYEATIASLIVGRLARLPVIYHGHSAHADELPLYVSAPWARRWMARVGRTLDAHVPRRADFCIAVSDDLAARLQRVGVAPSAVAAIPPALAPGELDEAAPPGTDGVVCYAGNLDGYQNLELLLASFARVRAAEPQARLRLVSHPDAAGHARRLAERGLGPGVEIILADSYARARAEIAAAAVAVCPRAEPSGFPMKLLSYLALGKAVVASAGSAKGLADGASARVVADGDADAFAAAILDLLRDPGERRRLGAAARRSVQDGAAWEASLDRLESIYAGVLANDGAVLLPVTATE